MTKEEAGKLITQLRNGEISEFLIKRADFLAFREVLVAQPDFKQFKGIAKHGGDVIYRYLETPRS